MMSAITLRDDPSMHYAKLVGVLVVLFSLCMISIGAELEGWAIAGIKKVTAEAPHVLIAGAAAAPDEAKADAKVEIVRDRFLMFLGAGGAFAGALVCVALRWAWAIEVTDKTRMMMSAYFVVSLFTSFFCTPMILKRYFTAEPEEMLGGSFLVASGAWVAWEVLAAIGRRLVKAAKDRGWFGVKEELWGNTRDVSAVPSTASPTPAVPGSKSEKL